MRPLGKIFSTLSLALIVHATALAAVTVTLYPCGSESSNTNFGTVTFKNSSFGLLIEPNLQGLPAGGHGFHIHQNPSCGDSCEAAGGHLDPHKTGKHLGPYDTKGHLGDLPILIVKEDGTSTLPMLAPKLKEKDIQHHTLMIHAGGDNYSDTPEKLGGGGARLACGVIP